MRLISKLALAGFGLVALAGGAAAAEQAMHTMNVKLADGSVAHIRYVGDTPPQVSVERVAVPVVPIALADPLASWVAFDRVFADMDRQMAAAMQQAQAMARQPIGPDGKLDQAALKALPPGTVHYSFTSTSTGNGTCTQSYQMTSYGPNQAPKVVSQSSGDCSAMNQHLVPTAAKQSEAKAAPKPVGRDTI